MTSPSTSPPTGRRLRIPLVLLTHPFELGIATGTVIGGIRGVLGSVTPSLKDLPQAPLGLYLIVSTVGAVGVIVGACQASTIDRTIMRVAFGLTLERASLILVGAAYTALAILLIYKNGTQGTTTATAYGFIALACGLRAIAIRRAGRAVLTTLTLANLDHRDDAA